jgi:hypothetical protein
MALRAVGIPSTAHYCGVSAARRRREKEEEWRECEILTTFSELLYDSLLLIAMYFS